MQGSLLSLRAIRVVFSPGSPLGPQSPTAFPLKTIFQPRDGGRARAGGGGYLPGFASAPARGPAATFARARRRPPTSPPPTPRLLCCSSSLGSLECTGLAEPSPAPPPPRLGEGLAEGGRRRGGDAREEELWLQRPGSLERPGPSLRPGARDGRKSWPRAATRLSGHLIGLRIFRLGRLQGVNRLFWITVGDPEGGGEGCLKSAEASSRSLPSPPTPPVFSGFG